MTEVQISFKEIYQCWRGSEALTGLIISLLRLSLESQDLVSLAFHHLSYWYVDMTSHGSIGLQSSCLLKPFWILLYSISRDQWSFYRHNTKHFTQVSITAFIDTIISFICIAASRHCYCLQHRETIYPISESHKDSMSG